MGMCVLNNKIPFRLTLPSYGVDDQILEHLAALISTDFILNN